MGVFASYTGQADFNDTGSPLNYMYNQKVDRISGGPAWTYASVKYWAGKAGEKISFFAYAPYDLPAGCLALPGNTNAGNPTFIYTSPSKAEDQPDLLAAAAANLTNSGTVGFTFRHLTAEITFQVLATENIMVTGVTVTNATTAQSFQLGSAGLIWGERTADPSTRFTATMNKTVTANTPTDVATFFLLANRIKSKDPASGNSTQPTLNYNRADGTVQTKTSTLTEGWEAGDVKNFVLKPATEAPVPTVGINVRAADINLGGTGCSSTDKASLAKLTWAEGNLKSTGSTNYVWAPTQYEFGYYYMPNSTYTGDQSSTGIDPCTKLDPAKYGTGWRTPSKNELDMLARCTDNTPDKPDGITGALWFMNKPNGVFLPFAGSSDKSTVEENTYAQ